MVYAMQSQIGASYSSNKPNPLILPDQVGSYVVGVDDGFALWDNRSISSVYFIQVSLNPSCGLNPRAFKLMNGSTLSLYHFVSFSLSLFLSFFSFFICVDLSGCQLSIYQLIYPFINIHARIDAATSHHVTSRLMAQDPATVDEVFLSAQIQVDKETVTERERVNGASEGLPNKSRIDFGFGDPGLTLGK